MILPRGQCVPTTTLSDSLVLCLLSIFPSIPPLSGPSFCSGPDFLFVLDSVLVPVSVLDFYISHFIVRSVPSFCSGSRFCSGYSVCSVPVSLLYPFSLLDPVSVLDPLSVLYPVSVLGTFSDLDPVSVLYPVPFLSNPGLRHRARSALLPRQFSSLFLFDVITRVIFIAYSFSCLCFCLWGWGPLLHRVSVFAFVSSFGGGGVVSRGRFAFSFPSSCVVFFPNCWASQAFASPSESNPL